MPNFLDAPELLPLPTLQTYASISFLLLSCALYYAFQVSSEPDWKLNEFLFTTTTTNLQQQQQLNQNKYFNNVDIDNGTSNYQNENITLNNDDIFSSSPSSLLLPSSIRNLLIEALFHLTKNSSSSSSSTTTTSIPMESTMKLNEFINNNEKIMKLIQITNIMINEPLCVWTLINMSYCLLIIFGKFIQKLIFGELRQSEQQLLRDKFWNFLLYKFIFVFSVINVQYMDELILWCAWYSLLGFLYLLTNLCKERYNFLINRPPIISRFTHMKLLLLLVSILISTIPLIIISFIISYYNNLSNGLFLFCEILMITLRSLQCLILYIIHLIDLNNEHIWERRTTIIYYIELTFDLLILIVDFSHHLHMLLSGNIILSLSVIVILIQIRSIFTEIVCRIRKHRNYLQVLNLMKENFPQATADELNDENNDCAICWDRMESARKLPCGHIFHTTCLRSWLEQDTSCPTCRFSLRQRDQNGSLSASSTTGTATTTINGQNIVGGTGFEDLANIANLAGLRAGNTRFFHFDGSRYATWLPSFSVEVTRPNLMDININASVRNNINNNNGNNNNNASNNTNDQQQQQQLQSMARQVLEWFPQYSLQSILDDLRLTHSVELTIENILDGRLLQNSSNINSISNMATITSTSSNNNNDNYHQNQLIESNSVAINDHSSSGGSNSTSNADGDDDDDDDIDLIEILDDGDNF